MLDLSPGAPALTEQLRLGLARNAARVIDLDLFKEWDVDRDGKVSTQ